ncbi:MAG: hypothetical protein H0U76_23955 [Ktedonobacteraceae bacterium]|nr:hypothetical protein [Ktedonobacteraceae bacterium]
MNCEELNQLLPDLVDDTLVGDVRIQAEAALLECPDCQRDLQIARQIRTLLITLQSQQPSLQVPPGFEARLLARVRTQQAGLEILDLSSQTFVAWLVEFINLVGGLINAPSPTRSA